jgi:hypothetical protein
VQTVFSHSLLREESCRHESEYSSVASTCEGGHIVQAPDGGVLWPVGIHELRPNGKGCHIHQLLARKLLLQVL